MPRVLRLRSSRSRRSALTLGGLAATLLAAAAAAAAPAQAQSICVNYVAPASVPCSLIVSNDLDPGAGLASALQTAAGAPGNDTIFVGPGQYDHADPYVYEVSSAATDAVTVVGTAGARGATVLHNTTATNQGSVVRGEASAGPITLKNLTISGASPTGSSGVTFGTPGSGLDGVDVKAQSGNVGPGAGVTGPGVAITTSTITGFDTGVDLLGGTVALATITDSTVAGKGIAVRDQGVASNLLRSAFRSDSSSTSGTGTIVDFSQGMTITDSLITNLGAAGTGFALVVAASAGASNTTNIEQSTILAPSAKAISNFGGSGGHDSTLTFRGSIVGPGTGIFNNDATNGFVELITSRWDGAAATGSAPVTAAAGTVTADPQFRSAADFHLGPGSPLVDGYDRSLTPADGDADGAARVLDGDGDGAARADLGAFELQPPVAAALPDNLLMDGDAEAGIGATNLSDGAADAPPLATPGWTRGAGTMTQARYGVEYAARVNVAAALGGGAQYFVGGPQSPLSTAEQTVDITADAVAIDGGLATATLGALLGSYGNGLDTMTITATFQGANGTAVGSPLVIGPPAATALGSATTLVRRSASVVVPAGTRRIRTVMRAERVDTGDDFNDASADNVSLTVAAPPAPPVVPTTPAPAVSAGGGSPAPVPGPPAPLAPARYAGLAITGGTLLVDPKGKFAVTVACPAAAVTRCTGTVAITRTTGKGKKKNTATLVSGPVTVLAGTSAAVSLKLAPKNRKLATKSGTAVQVVATSTDARAGAAVKVVTTAGAKLKPAPVKKKPAKK